MADNFDNYGMKVRATVDMPSVSDIDKQIRKLEKSISKLQVSGKLDDASLKALSHQLDTLKATVTTANFSPTALTELTNQVEKALGKVQLSGSLAKIGEDIGSVISQGAKQNIDSSIANEMKKISDSSTSTMIQNENKKQKEISESTAQYKELLGLLSKLQDIQNRVVNSPTRSKFSNVNLWKRNEIYSADDYTESWQAAKNIKTKYGEYTKSVSNGKSIEIQQATFDQVGKLIENYFVQYGKHSADILKQSLPKKMHPLIDEISDDVASFGERLKQYRAENIKQYGESIISSAYETVKAQIASMGKDVNVRTITEPGDDIFDDVTKTISASDDIKSIIPDVSYNADTATESWKNFDAILQQVCNALGVEIPKAESTLESQSTSTANTVVQNEEKKQQAIQETASAYKSFSELRNSGTIGGYSKEIEYGGEKQTIVDAEETLKRVREIYSEFGQVKITNQTFDQNGELQSFRVNIQQLNGDLKETRSFMMGLTDDFKFTFTDDIIKGSESIVHHLNEVQNATSQVKTEEEKFAEEMAKVREKSEQARQAEEKRQELAQSNAINKALEEEYAQKQKLIAQEERLAQEQAEKVNKIQLLSNGGIKNDYATQIAKLEGDFRSLGLAQDTIATKTQNVKNSLATLKTEFAKPVDQQNFQAIQTANDNLQRELIESRNEYERLKASMKGMATEQQRLSLANTIEAWNQKNTAATREVVDENHRYIMSLRDLNTQMTKMDFGKISTGFKQNENSMRAMNRLGKSLKEQFTQAYQSFTMWLSASSLVMKVISETREAFTELKEVNTLLTEISKANENLNKQQLAKIADDGFDIASDYGKSVTHYLSGVQEASRAGYENAEAIAELSVAIQGAGDVTEDIANKYVIATDKAYGLKGSVEELTKVFDGSNYITNKNAVNMTELADGMSIVGSTAASFGIEVNETTAALGTMIASTQQSGSEMARAFRAILLNIRQVSDEEEGIDAEGLTKYEKACNALGVSLKETRNGVLQTRDAMDVLKELSVEYNKLEEGDLRRTQLLNSVGGKVCHVI